MNERPSISKSQKDNGAFGLDNHQFCVDVIAVLVHRLGGHVNLTQADFDMSPTYAGIIETKDGPTYRIYLKPKS
mgnify:FL=1